MKPLPPHTGLSIRVAGVTLKCVVEGRYIKVLQVGETMNGSAEALERARERLIGLAKRVYPGKVVQG